MGALDLLFKAGAKKVAPFFSKADVILDELQRGKGTGDEFLTELVKKGVKPTELKDRGLDKALKGKPKMTKAEVQKVFEQKAPPKVQEKVLGPSPDYDEFLEQQAQERYGVDYWELRKDEKAKINKMFDELGTAEYERYKTPGGENYREILLKLPAFDIKRLMELEADIRRSDEIYSNPASMKDYQAKVAELAQLKQQQAAAGTPYTSGHYKEDPNLLAHIRVQDFNTPDGKKVLLVDELQSDWHQEGRKKGYKQELSSEDKDRLAQIVNTPNWATDEKMLADFKSLNAKAKSAEQGVPDAPFKKNWHELSMKRVLDYAAENGYDSVAITPGVQQVRRYEDATRQAVDEVAMYGDTLVGFKGGRRVIEQPISSPDELEQYIGKDMAQKLSSAAPDMNFIRSIKGEDITVGGEGMKGFYDKILPDYLNNYGKKYGAQMGEMDLVTAPGKSTPQVAAPGIGYFPEPLVEPAQTMRFHSFDITPQMREQIKTKGQPLYSQIGIPGAEAAAGVGAATIAPEVFNTDNEQQVQNPVHFTENPDAMLLELMQRN